MCGPLSQIVPDAQHVAHDKAFLGKIIEVAFVTQDYKKTINQMLALGIGPWLVYTFNPQTCTDMTYHGEPTECELKVAFCLNPSNQGINWEIIQPLSGNTVFDQYLKAGTGVAGNGGGAFGINHVAFDCNGMAWDDRIKEFQSRGFKFVQGASWQGTNHFAFFEMDGPGSTCIETIAIDPTFKLPTPEETYA